MFRVWVAYLLLACVLLGPLVVRMSSHILADDAFIETGRSDAYNFLWTYWWIQKAVLAGQNFYQCDWVYPPTGANLFFHTHVVLPTLLTIPLGMLLGPVGGYNAMILLLLSGGASVYAAFVRSTFECGATAAFIVGALFGFCPYFVFKVHAHVNLVGAVFWSGCLGTLVHAYRTQRFGARRGLAFSACLWATFWTSFVEFFALLVACAATVLAFEIATRSGERHARLAGRFAYFAMLLPGCVSLLSLANAPRLDVVDVDLFPNARFLDLLAPPRLSVWGGVIESSAYEYWGSHIPLALVVLAAIGLAIWPSARGASRKERIVIASLAAFMLLLTLNPLNAPLAVLRLLPTGSGFRVAARFLPFVYFFALIPAAYGLTRLLEWRATAPRLAALLALAALTALEYYPWQLAPSAVKQFAVPEAVAEEGARGAFTLIVPRKSYTNAHDTYQVSMDVPVVQLSYLAREDRAAKAERVRRFPALYAAPHAPTPRELPQLRAAGVRFVLYEDERAYTAGKLRGETLAQQAGAVLVRY